MAPARVRGCAAQASPPAGRLLGQADASRRRNGPRKATSRRLITVRLRSKSCLDGRYRVSRVGRRAVVAQRWPRTPQQANVGSKTRSAGRVPPTSRSSAQSGRVRLNWAQTDQKAVRIDVEVSEERNPRQSDRRERVELTIRSRGPAIRAEAAADDRYAAFDLAFAKIESRLRRAADRRKVKDTVSVRSPGVLAGATPEAPPGPRAGAPAAASEMNGYGVARSRPGEGGDGDA